MMAQRAKRRSPQARKAPPWVSDDVLAKLGAALGDDTFVRDARRTPFVWSEGVLRVVDHLGGVLAPSELERRWTSSSATTAWSASRSPCSPTARPWGARSRR